MFLLGFSVLIALLAGTLTAVNNGVRISFAMALDPEMPDVLGFFDRQVKNPYVRAYTTPYFAVIILCTISTLIAAVGLAGGLPALLGIILASNLGAFLLYALLCGLTMATFARDTNFDLFHHRLLPGLGVIANVGIAVAMAVVGLSMGGILTQASLLAFGLAAVWLVASIASYAFKRGFRVSPG